MQTGYPRGSLFPTPSHVQPGFAVVGQRMVAGTDGSPEFGCEKRLDHVSLEHFCSRRPHFRCL